MTDKRHGRREDRRNVPVVERPAPRPAVLPATLKHEPQQSFLVVIENLMAQALEVSVLDEGGAVTGVMLTSRGLSDPIHPDRVGQRTHDLVKSGRVRIRSA